MSLSPFFEFGQVSIYLTEAIYENNAYHQKGKQLIFSDNLLCVEQDPRNIAHGTHLIFLRVLLCNYPHFTMDKMKLKVAIQFAVKQRSGTEPGVLQRLKSRHRMHDVFGCVLIYLCTQHLTDCPAMGVQQQGANVKLEL
jgi:hypothetical protein